VRYKLFTLQLNIFRWWGEGEQNIFCPQAYMNMFYLLDSLGMELA